MDTIKANKFVRNQRDLAEVLGISRTSISRILGGDEKAFKPETVKKVKDAAKKLCYIPNAAARSLKSNKTSMIGVLLPRIEGQFYQRILSALEKNIGSQHVLLLGVSEYDCQKERKILETFIKHKVDGVVAACTGEKSISNLNLFGTIRANAKIVLIDRNVPGFEAPLVCSDHIKGTFDITNYLIQRGHKRIAYIASGVKLSSTIEQKSGYCQAMKLASLADDNFIISEFAEMRNPEFGEQAANIIINNHINVSAAVINDALIPSFVKKMKSHNIEVPRDISLIGIDDLQFSEYMTPPMHVMRQQIESISHWAVDILFKNINQNDSGTALQIKIPASITERESVRILTD